LAILPFIGLPASGEEKAGVEQVVVVFKTHFDIGFTDLPANVVQRYRTSMIDKALEVCDATRQLPPENRFVWTLPGWPMAQVLWPGQTEQRRRQVEAAVREGRLVWHALPVTTHTESFDLEDFVRGMVFSSRLSQQFGLPLARDAKMTDVPSHTWILPTILRRAGVTFLHLGCNPCSSSPEVPDLFWWEGPDGSRLLTMYTGKDYGTGLVPPPGWPFKTWLALIHTGDNHGPPTPQEVQDLLTQAKQRLPGVKIRFGRLSDFGDAILQEKPDLPVVRADMPDTWIHGLMSMPVETKLARNLRPQIAALDALHTLAGARQAGLPSIRQRIADAYEQTLLYGEHTWGDRVIELGYRYGKAWEEAMSKGHYGPVERASAAHGDYARKAASLVGPALAEELQALGRAVRIDGPRIVVFNPLPWARDDLVSVEFKGSAPMALRDVADNRVTAVSVEGKKISFLARGVPSLGYRTYVPSRADEHPATAPAAGLASDGPVLENEFFVARLDAARGGIVSLVDKRSGRELVDDSSPYVLGQYFYERFDADINESYLASYCKIRPDWTSTHAKPNLPPAKEVPYVSASPKQMKLRVERTAAAQVATLVASSGGGIPHDVALRVTLPRGQALLELEWTVTNKKPDPWPETAWLCLPLKVAGQAAFRLGRLGSIVDPSKDLCRWSNHDLFCLNSGAVVQGENGLGMGLCPIDSLLVSLGYPGLFRYTRQWSPRKPLVLVNLFNNMWGTNFQQWIGGTWSSRVRLWAAGKDAESDLITPSWEARNPCLAAWCEGPAGAQPPLQTGIELSRKGVLLTALGPNPDGDGLLLRLWEQVGGKEPCTVRFPTGLRPRRVQPSDLRGRPIGRAIPVENGQVTVPCEPFAPVSLLLAP
jgi:hypothetical protein